MDALQRPGQAQPASARDKNDYYPVLRWMLRSVAAILIASIPTRLSMHDLAVGVPFTWETRQVTVSVGPHLDSFSLILFLLDVGICLLAVSFLTRLIKRGCSRHLVLTLILLAASGVAGISWRWRYQTALPDPTVVIRTSPEAVTDARKFLALAGVNAGNYDLAHPSDTKEDRSKGWRCWGVRWHPKTGTNDLFVCVGETGWFDVWQPHGANQEEEIQGDLKEIYDRRVLDR